LRSAAEIEKKLAYRAQRFVGRYCNSYLMVAEDIAGADDHRNRSKGSDLATGRTPRAAISTITPISASSGVVVKHGRHTVGWTAEQQERSTRTCHDKARTWYQADVRPLRRQIL
jgi:hypothetical protein